MYNKESTGDKVIKESFLEKVKIEMNIQGNGGRGTLRYMGWYFKSSEGKELVL